MTASELVESYIRETILRPETVRSYRIVARVFENDIGARNISAIDRELVLKWRGKILNRALPTTWNSYRMHLGVIWNFAKRRGLAHSNPFMETRRAPVLQKKKKTVSDNVLAEAMALLGDADKAPYPGWFWATAVRLLYCTGMRRRQLTSLRWDDIDLDARVILLRAESSKTKREWSIPIPAACFTDLIELRDRTLKINATAIANNDQVFRVGLFYHRYYGKELSPEQLGGFFKRLSAKLGSKVSSHRLRHTMATELARGENRDLKALQVVLGHTDLRTTLEYVHPDQSQLRQLLDGLIMPARRVPTRLSGSASIL